MSEQVGRKRAVFIGINYFGTKAELGGCIDDAKNMKQLLTEKYGFQESDTILLTDDQEDAQPTAQKIKEAIQWLVNDQQANDSYFFFYSGHGGSTEDADEDEVDKKDEYICPVDGDITDDELHKLMIAPLKEGVKLTAVFDSCRSGTVLDLPYNYYVRVNKLAAVGEEDDGSLSDEEKTFREKNANAKGSLANVIEISGCKDTQTSTVNVKVGAGALTHALRELLAADLHPTYRDLLIKIRVNMVENGFTQVPQLTVSRDMDLSDLKFDI